MQNIPFTHFAHRVDVFLHVVLVESIEFDPNAALGQPNLQGAVRHSIGVYPNKRLGRDAFVIEYAHHALNGLRVCCMAGDGQTRLKVSLRGSPDQLLVNGR